MKISKLHAIRIFPHREYSAARYSVANQGQFSFRLPASTRRRSKMLKPIAKSGESSNSGTLQHELTLQSGRFTDYGAGTVNAY